VIVQTNEPITARSVSWLWYKRIYVGTKFIGLPERVKMAVLAHELAHCEGHHTEWRLLALICPIPLLIQWLCHWQEYQADAYVAQCGFGPELSWYLRKDGPGSITHPQNYLRRQKLVHNKFFARPPLRAN
jgi:Zn-dependent protease with chaperone function